MIRYDEHYFSIDHYFGLHEYLTVSGQKLSSVGHMIDEYIKDGYIDFPEKLWEDSTFDGKPILRMLHKISKTGQDCIAIIVRNSIGA